jgi:GNAT superfamily N-acetyltransferase
MLDAAMIDSTLARGTVRTLTTRELPLFIEHMLRLDRDSRHDRFNGFIDESFIERYATRCMSDGTIIIAYLEDGVVRGAAELHQPDLSPGSLPEIAFSVEACMRRKGVGSILFTMLIAKAKSLGYESLRITTGAENKSMRALANKFGAHLTFRHGESTGSIDLNQPNLAAIKLPKSPAVEIAHAVANYNRAWWKIFMGMYGIGRAA